MSMVCFVPVSSVTITALGWSADCFQMVVMILCMLVFAVVLVLSLVCVGPKYPTRMLLSCQKQGPTCDIASASSAAY